MVSDNSGSLDYKTEDVLARLEEEALQFVKSGMTGDRFQMAVFTTTGSVISHDVCVEYELKIVPPAWESCKKQTEALRGLIRKAWREAGTVERTPLLETLDFIGWIEMDGPTKHWEVVIIGDLMQATKALTVDSVYLKGHSDEEILDDMKRICRRPKIAPSSIQVYYYPGQVDRGHLVSLRDYERVHWAFSHFLQWWAGADCKVTFNSL